MKIPKYTDQFVKEIKRIAESSRHCQGVSLSHFCGNGNELKMWHDVSSDRLSFIFTDNSKPFYYKEAVKIDDGNYTVIDRKFDDKVRCISYDYPYYEKVTPAKIEATIWDAFKVFEYEFREEKKERLPNYNEVERLIYCAFETFKICA